MGWVLALFVTGFAALLIALGVAFNTSMGGTRSDYSDSSDLWATVGGLLLLASIGVLAWWVFS